MLFLFLISADLLEDGRGADLDDLFDAGAEQRPRRLVQLDALRRQRSGDTVAGAGRPQVGRRRQPRRRSRHAGGGADCGGRGRRQRRSDPDLAGADASGALQLDGAGSRRRQQQAPRRRRRRRWRPDAARRHGAHLGQRRRHSDHLDVQHYLFYLKKN